MEALFSRRAEAVAKSLPAELIFHGALALYYFSWMFGLTSDTQEEELIYTHAPKNVERTCVGFGILFIVAFGALCYVKTKLLFAVLLTVFLVINILSWQFFVKRFMKRASRETRTDYEKCDDFIGLERIRLIYDEYLCGKWQWIRFASGLTIVAAIDLLAFSDTFANFSIDEIGHGSADLLMAFLLVFFVAIMEMWIWIARIGMNHQLSFLEKIEKQYILKRRT